MIINKNTIFLTFEFIEFIESDHQYAFLIKSATKEKLISVTVNQFKSTTTVNTNRIRTNLKTSNLSKFWSLKWIINKFLFKRALRKFEFFFSKLQRDHSENSSNFIIKQSKHVNIIDITSAAKFSTINNNSSSSHS